MFTGIVQGTAAVVGLERREGFSRITLELPEASSQGLQRGASLSISGVCLTVTDFEGPRVSFDAMIETLRLTNLGALRLGDRVNFERAARLGDEIGGHLVSGHVQGLARIVSIAREAETTVMSFAPPPQLEEYVLEKGFIALDGCSLTICADVPGQFRIYFIPETLKVTSFGWRKVGDLINIEIDPQTQAIVDTVKRYLARRGQ